MLNFLNESKELDWSAFKAGSKGLMILPDQTSQSQRKSVLNIHWED